MTGKQIEAIKKINQQRRKIIWHYKVAMELKKANESYKHQIMECEKQKRMLIMLKKHNKAILEKKTYVHLRRQYDIMPKDRKSTRLNSSHRSLSRMPSSA